MVVVYVYDEPSNVEGPFGVHVLAAVIHVEPFLTQSVGVRSLIVAADRSSARSNWLAT